MKSAAWTILAILLLGASLFPTAQAKGPMFFEDILIGGDVNDFSNGALDIDSVYVSELYPYDIDKDQAFDRVVVRIEPRNLNEMSNCQVPTGEGYASVCQVRYDVRFQVAGQDRHVFVVLDPPGKDSCCPISSSNTLASTDQTSVRLSLDRNELLLLPGTAIEKLHVTSDLIAGGRTQAGDRAPGDNGNVPHDQHPSLDGFAAPYPLEGTYPFFTVEAVDGTHRDSVGGQAVEFDFKVIPAQHVKEDTIRFLFDIPEGWSVMPDRGTTGRIPKGLLTGLSEGMVGELSVQVSASGIVEEGQIAMIVTHIYSSSQGYEALPLTVRVTGATIDDPAYAFQWQSAGNLREGSTSTLRFRVLDLAGEPRTQLPIDVVFSKDGRRITTVPATADGDGYRVDYAFPSAGAWTVDARVTNLQPSPHGEATVNVSKDATVPGAGPLLVLLLLGVAAAIKGRLQSRP